MRKKKKAKRLDVKRDTLRRLGDELARVRGGGADPPLTISGVPCYPPFPSDNCPTGNCNTSAWNRCDSVGFCTVPVR